MPCRRIPLPFPPQPLPHGRAGGCCIPGDQPDFSSSRAAHRLACKTNIRRAEHSYTVNAAAGQTMLVSVASSLNDVFLKIEGTQYGEQLLSSDAEQSSWSVICRQSRNTALCLPHPAQPQITFCASKSRQISSSSREKTHLKIDGYVDIFSEWYPNVMTRVRYLLPASPEKTVTAIRLTSPDISNLSLGISGQTDGQPYKRYEISGIEYIAELPLTQGYYLDVYSLGSSTGFTLEIEFR